MKKIFLGLLFVLLSQSVHARYFDPEGGRFINRDPLEYIDGMNLYAGYFAQRFQVDPDGTKLTEMPPVEEKIDYERATKNGKNNAITNVKTFNVSTTISYDKEKCCHNLVINGEILVTIYYKNSYVKNSVSEKEPTTTTWAHEMRHVRDAEIFWTKLIQLSNFLEDCYFTRDDAEYAKKVFEDGFKQAVKDRRASEDDYHNDIGQ